MSVAAIVLAAGASRRMGRPKPLLPWGGVTLLAWELEVLQQSCVDRVVVVTGRAAGEVRRSLGEGARRCVFNPRWALGRAGSLAAGARALLRSGDGAPEAVLVQNVDQPTRAEIIDRLVRALLDGGHEAVQPSFGGKTGHPVAVAGALLPALAEAREETLGLRGVLAEHPPFALAMDEDAVVRIDLDTPGDLAEARRLLGVAGDGTR